jgi:outer membrane lipoprotein carrier protein
MFTRRFGYLTVLLATTFGGVSSAALAQGEPNIPDVPEAAPPPPTTGPGAPGSADAIADRVQAFYDQAKTYKAKFKQRFTIYAYNRTKDSSGEVVFSKPGKMRWKYTSNGNEVVSDGKQIKIYEKENKQMYLQQVDKTQYPAALSFLLGNGSLRKEFALTKLDAEQFKFPGGYVLLGTPRAPTPAYQKILFYIDANTAQVRRVLLVDAQKNRNRFDFEEARANEVVTHATFNFTPPPGTSVVKP